MSTSVLYDRVEQQLQVIAVRAKGPLGLALSGGGDSMALLHCAAAWSQRHDKRILVYGVDHGLRPSSLEDVQWACARAQALGLQAEVLSWKTDSPPSTGLQEQARRARYALMASRLRQAGGGILLTGHTQDDQIETFVLRLLKHKNWRSWDGMRAFAPCPVWPEGAGVWLARPLLGLSRVALRNCLRELGENWLEDPSNDSPVFSRVRVRKHLNALAEKGFSLQRLAGLQASFARLKTSEHIDAAKLLQKGVAFQPEGYASLHRDAFKTFPTSTGRLAFGVALVCVCGEEGFPQSQSLMRLFNIFMNRKGRGGTLNGARLVMSSKACFLTRDPGAVLGRGSLPTLSQPEPLVPGQPHVWDGRFSMMTDAKGVWAGPLGDHVQALSDEARARLSLLPLCVRRLLPAFFREGCLVAVPALDFKPEGLYTMRSLVETRAEVWQAYALSVINHEGLDPKNRVYNKNRA